MFCFRRGAAPPPPNTEGLKNTRFRIFCPIAGLRFTFTPYDKLIYIIIFIFSLGDVVYSTINDPGYSVIRY